MNHPRSLLHRVLPLALLCVPLAAGCGGSSSTEDVPAAGAGGVGGKGGAAGSGGAGSGGAAGSTAGKGGAAGTAGVSGGSGQGGAGAGAGGASGSSGQAGAGTAGVGGDAGTGGTSAGTAGTGAGEAGAAGAAAGCEQDPLVGQPCASGLPGVCSVGHNKCIQGAISCVPDVGPGEQAEACDGLDNDCDGETDEGLPKNTYFIDADGDGFGSTATVQACALAAGLSEKGNDCNDNNNAIFPGAAEVCNSVDDNCDGNVDEGVQKNTYFVDADGDGYGSTATQQACALVPGLSDKSTDCNDSNASIHPGATEDCNNVDDNCNGQVDEGTSISTYYQDNDGDGFGSAVTTKACVAPTGYVSVGGDCNDQNANINPKGIEICNDADDNCNGIVDEGVQKLTFFKDNDGDGFGGPSTTLACTAPAGFVAEAGDCNDFNKTIYPGAPEQCNTIDDDCNGVVDDPDKITQYKIYKDNDGDGFAALGAPSEDNCKVPVGWTLPKDANGDGQNDWDCDDSNNTVFPGAKELCDGKDNNCDGLVDSQCPLSCPGSWPVTMAVPYHTPARMMDLNGDSLEELYITDAYGKLQRISHTGVLTNICPTLTFPVGYGSRLSFTVNPALGTWNYYAQTGTRLFDLNTCKEVYPSALDKQGFGVVGDFDGDHKLDYAGHNEVDPQVCFKLSSKGYAVQCLTSPNSKPYDSYITSFDIDKDGKSEAVLIRGRTFPDDSVYDGSIDTFRYDGSQMVLAGTVSGAVTGATGSHMNGLDIADWSNDGYSKVLALFNGGFIDLAASTKSASFSYEGTPIPTTFDLNGDGKLEGIAQGAEVDLDLDGIPESIKAVSNNQVTIVKNDAAQTPLSGWPLTLGAFTWSVLPVVGDADNDNALEVYTPSQDGVVYCRRLGEGTNKQTNIIQRGEPEWINRTMTKDAYEPNNVREAAWPLRFPTKEIRAYLTRGDVDYYQLPGVGGLAIQLWSPAGADYDFFLENEDGTKIYASGTSGGTGGMESLSVCVGCTQAVPSFYTLRIVPKDPTKDFSNTRPYVLRIGQSS